MICTDCNGRGEDVKLNKCPYCNGLGNFILDSEVSHTLRIIFKTHDSGFVEVQKVYQNVKPKIVKAKELYRCLWALESLGFIRNAKQGRKSVIYIL